MPPRARERLNEQSIPLVLSRIVMIHQVLEIRTYNLCILSNKRYCEDWRADICLFWRLSIVMVLQRGSCVNAFLHCMVSCLGTLVVAYHLRSIASVAS